MSNYSNNYSDDSFFDKIKNSFKKAGAKVIYNALVLYNILKSEYTPAGDKAIIIGALGYFIFPIDAIPDFLVPLGYTDDLAILIAALQKVRGNLDDDMKDRAKSDLDDFFGEDSHKLLG